MTPRSAPKPKPTPLIPAPRDEDILKAVAEYHFPTAQEITRLCYSTGSLTYARSRLSALSGNQDITDKALTYDYPLWRIGFPTGKRGNNERIFALSLTGRQMLERLGIPVSWHFRPEQLRTFSHSYLLHDLTRNRFVVSLLSWAKKSKPNLTVESRLSYSLAKTPVSVSIPVQNKMVKVGVIPDGEIVVTNTSSGERLLLLLEIDHNTQARERLRTHIAALLAYVKSPHFRAHFGNIHYRIVYATQGVTDSASRARLAYLCDFTLKYLIERKRGEDSQYFRFTNIDYARLYTDAKHLFEEPSWYLPGEMKRQSPVALFPDAKPQPQKE